MALKSRFSYSKSNKKNLRFCQADLLLAFPDFRALWIPVCVCKWQQASQEVKHCLWLRFQSFQETQNTGLLMREFHITCNNLKTFVYEDNHSNYFLYGIHLLLSFSCLLQPRMMFPFSFTSNISVLYLIFNVFEFWGM